MRKLKEYINEKFQVGKDSIFTNTIEDTLATYGCVEKHGVVAPRSYHADKLYCKVFKKSTEANYAISNFYNKLPINDNNRFSLWDIIDQRQLDIIDDKKYENITIQKYVHLDDGMFKVGICDTTNNMIFHISFERDIWVVSDSREITDEEIDDCKEICKEIIDYIFSNY